MNINGLVFPELIVKEYKPSETHPEVKIENGIIWVKCFSGDSSCWIQAEALKNKENAKQDLYNWLAWKLDIAARDLLMSKAAIKRDLQSRGIISR